MQNRIGLALLVTSPFVAVGLGIAAYATGPLDGPILESARQLGTQMGGSIWFLIGALIIKS